MTTNSFLEVNGLKLENLEGEQWKEVYSRYLISNKGRIVAKNWKNSQKASLMKPAITGGYLKTTFVINGKHKHIQVHREVLKAFQPHENQDKLTCNHKDLNKLNNCLDNLEWMTMEENRQHAVEHGHIGYRWTKGMPYDPRRHLKGERIGTSKVTEQMVREIRAKFKPRVYTREMLAQEYGLKPSGVKDIILRKSWKHVK